MELVGIDQGTIDIEDECASFTKHESSMIGCALSPGSRQINEQKIDTLNKASGLDMAGKPIRVGASERGRRTSVFGIGTDAAILHTPSRRLD